DADAERRDGKNKVGDARRRLRRLLGRTRRRELRRRKTRKDSQALRQTSHRHRTLHGLESPCALRARRARESRRQVDVESYVEEGSACAEGTVVAGSGAGREDAAFRAA